MCKNLTGWIKTRWHDKGIVLRVKMVRLPCLIIVYDPERKTIDGPC